MSKLQDIKLLFSEYTENTGCLSEKFNALKDAEISTENFSFYTSVSSVFSSKIEGENVELDSYIKHKLLSVAFQPDYTKKIDDLYEAYSFAQNQSLNKNNLMKVHQILSQNLLQKNQQGAYRNGNMVVMTEDGRIEYVACSPHEVEKEMEDFFAELDELLKENLTTEESFFYASLLHLVFVKIHPMNDGNGRTARLLEKWFLAEKLGKKAWYLQSEKYYYQQHQAYYRNIRKLGFEYEELQYEKSLDFLLMLPKSLEM